MVYEKYNPDVFSNLSFYDNVSDDVKESLEPLLQVIQQHKLEKSIGLSFLHKHFNLKPEEKLVETKGEFHSFIFPQIVSDRSVLPYMWKFEFEGTEQKLFPLEFVKVEEFEEVALAIKHLETKKEFIRDFGKTLQALGLFNTIGLIVKHRGHITKINRTTMEFTDSNRRILHIVPESMKPLDQEMLSHYENCMTNHGNLQSSETSWFVSDKVSGTKLLDNADVSKCSHNCHHVCLPCTWRGDQQHRNEIDINTSINISK